MIEEGMCYNVLIATKTGGEYLYKDIIFADYRGLFLHLETAKDGKVDFLADEILYIELTRN